MISKTKKPYIKISAALILVFTLSLTGLYGCGTKTISSPSTDNAGVSTSEKDAQSTNSPQSTTQSSPNATNTGSETNSLKGFISLLGMSKDKLIETLKEEPTTIDEGGLEFAKSGTRVWFEGKPAAVSQIFTQNKSLDLNGAKIGDSIDKFKEKFGTPVSDNNGDMHFKYGDVYLSINYDATTGATYALYILQKDF
jgi:hypothetical protein